MSVRRVEDLPRVGAVVTFNVHGIPKPKGSLDVFGPGRVRDSAIGIGDWMTAVEVAARKERERLGRTLVGPLRIDLVFRLPMPKNRPAALRRDGVVPCVVRPDGDKLDRAVWDALTRSTLILDDRQFCRWGGAKYEVWNSWTGAEIDIEEIVR